MKIVNIINDNVSLADITGKTSYNSAIAEMERYSDWLRTGDNHLFDIFEPGGGGGPGGGSAGGGSNGGTTTTTTTTTTNTGGGATAQPDNKESLDDAADRYWDELQKKKPQTAGFGSTWLLLAAAAIGAYSLRKQILK